MSASTARFRRAGANTGGIVVARRTTRIAAVVLVAGVVAQAAIAGGFLAGRPAIGELHQMLGHMLVVVGFVPLVAGLIGRRTGREPVTVLLLRVALGIVVLGAMLAGEIASRGTRDLLMAHMPLAVLIVMLSSHLLYATSSTDRDGVAEPATAREP